MHNQNSAQTMGLGLFLLVYMHLVSCECYRRVKETSSWAAPLVQNKQQHKQPEQSRGTPHHPRKRTRHNGKTSGTEPGSPESGMDWTQLTSSLRMPPLQNALKSQRIMGWCHFFCFYFVNMQVIPLLGLMAQGSVSCLCMGSQSPLILQAWPNAWGLASTSPELDRKSSPWFPL